MSSRAKRDSADRRVILDCNWPIGTSLNDGISKSWYDNSLVDLRYPTIDVLAKQIAEMAQESEEPIFLYKEDLDRAFRQLYAEFASIPLLGFQWRTQFYFDVVMVMGCQIAPYICQRTTNMISHVHRTRNKTFVLNYVDDFLGVEFESRVSVAHQLLIQLLNNVGLNRSPRKSVLPTQTIEFIGNLVDTINMTLGVMPLCRTEMLMELEKWRYKNTCSRNQMESLIGKLQFMSNCIRPGRLFVS